MNNHERAHKIDFVCQWSPIVFVIVVLLSNKTSFYMHIWAVCNLYVYLMTKLVENERKRNDDDGEDDEINKKEEKAI